jgi:hypothetical protein
MPTASDLVTDLPADFETFGQAVATSMADLLGGTTGQVLSKASNTDMDFTWVAADDANAIQNAIVDAKGDLIAATANDTPARLAVGNDGETLVADSSTSTGLRYTAGTAQSNPVINSAMQIWQRGTSVAGSTTAFAADRWQAYRGVAGSTFSRQVTNDTTNLPNIQYSMRAQRDSGNTSTSDIIALQNFESVNSIPFAGRTVTFSFYARAGANFSAASNVLLGLVYTGTGTDQNAIAGYTGQTTAINTSSVSTLTTTWQRFTLSGSLAATTTQIGIIFRYTPAGTAGANDWFEVTGVQLDIGSVALPFRTNGETIQGELAACQRYYYRQGGDAPFQGMGLGVATSTTNGSVQVALPVQMRVAPTSIDFSTLGLYSSGSVIAVTTATIDTASKNIVRVNAAVSSGLTQDRAYQLLANNSTSALIGFSAEL